MGPSCLSPGQHCSVGPGPVHRAARGPLCTSEPSPRDDGLSSSQNPVAIDILWKLPLCQSCSHLVPVSCSRSPGQLERLSARVQDSPGWALPPASLPCPPAQTPCPAPSPGLGSLLDHGQVALHHPDAPKLQRRKASPSTCTRDSPGLPTPRCPGHRVCGRAQVPLGGAAGLRLITGAHVASPGFTYVASGHPKNQEEKVPTL